MKKILLTLLFAICILQLKAQNFEIAVQANTGMSHYTGYEAVNTTFLDAAAPSDHTGYPNGDGSKFALNYGIDAQLQYIFKINFLLGLQAGYETISSEVNINGVYDGQQNEVPATGYTREHLGYINLNPYIGYRFKFNLVKLDIMPGLDLAYGEHTGETVNVKANDNTYYNRHTDNYDYKPRNDVRIRMGIAVYYKNIGINASYSRGEDIIPGPTGPLGEYQPTQTERIEAIRLGLSYQLK